MVNLEISQRSAELAAPSVSLQHRFAQFLAGKGELDGVRLLGPRTVEQLGGALDAVEIELGEEILSNLDDIFPGYKTAPEDYAW